MTYKTIKFGLKNWNVIKSFADSLTEERMHKVSLPSAVMEAVAFYKEHRKREKNDAENR